MQQLLHTLPLAVGELVAQPHVHVFAGEQAEAPPDLGQFLRRVPGQRRVDRFLVRARARDRSLDLVGDHRGAILVRRRPARRAGKQRLQVSELAGGELVAQAAEQRLARHLPISILDRLPLIRCAARDRRIDRLLVGPEAFHGIPDLPRRFRRRGLAAQQRHGARELIAR